MINIESHLEIKIQIVKIVPALVCHIFQKKSPLFISIKLSEGLLCKKIPIGVFDKMQMIPLGYKTWNHPNNSDKTHRNQQQFTRFVIR